MPEAYKPAARDYGKSRKALSRYAGLRIHYRRRQALHAADAQRKADRARRPCASRLTWWNKKLISKKEAVQRVAPNQLDQLLHPVLDPTMRKGLQKIATGLPASPGAAVGRAAFSSEDAVRDGGGGPGGAGTKRNDAGRHSRDGCIERHSYSGRRSDQPCGGGRARDGPALCRRCVIGRRR